MVNKSTNINKTNNYLLSSLDEHKHIQHMTFNIDINIHILLQISVCLFFCFHSTMDVLYLTNVCQQILKILLEILVEVRTSINNSK